MNLKLKDGDQQSMKQSILYIASDHAGFGMKKALISHLSKMLPKLLDLGPKNEDRTDYPDFADKLCQKLIQDKGAQGVLICGSGQGMAMRANKYPSIRAALCWNEESARLARKHNDANVLCMGARLLDENLSLKILKVFLDTEFEGGRHQTRVEKVSKPTQKP